MKLFPSIQTVRSDHHVWSLSSDESPMVIAEGVATTLSAAMSAIRRASKQYQAERTAWYDGASEVQPSESYAARYMSATATKGAHIRIYNSIQGTRVVARMSANHEVLATCGDRDTMLSVALTFTLMQLKKKGKWVIGGRSDNGILIAVQENNTNTVTIR